LALKVQVIAEKTAKKNLGGLFFCPTTESLQWYYCYQECSADSRQPTEV